MNSKIFKVILVILGVITISGMGAIIYLLVNEDDPDRELTLDEQLEYAYQTEEINLDLEDRRFVQLQFSIITNSEDARDEVEKREFQLKNILIKESVNLSSSELHEDLDSLERLLKEEMNEQMEEGEITDIYIISKIVQ
ncbi:flagellar FliL protein [Pelagirhabdus alkalitolerans]|uniref:Flagellar protein FliL n=1 Tax=Pelagirhabdus alkalitolerans TaxID=1612202 RepID=A0A1G6H339_9BACI|nr:flagellar basal body-associated FliL family protein [Pelagirhabdus alkalitolerans]SDB88730.1 flagellar FliL protein [Pelagirhabdus alkalitolerans]